MHNDDLEAEYPDGLETYPDPYTMHEADPFIGGLFKGAARLVRRAIPGLRRVLPRLIPGLGGILREDGFAPSFAAIDPTLLAEAESALSPQALHEIWMEVGARQGPEDLAEAMLDFATHAGSEDEALAFAGGMTITIAANAPWEVQRALPHLSRCTGHMVRTLYRHPHTRPLIPVVGRIARGAISDMTRHVQSGQALAPSHLSRILARRTAVGFGSPRVMTGALARSRLVRTRLNRRAVARVET